MWHLSTAAPTESHREDEEQENAKGEAKINETATSSSKGGKGGGRDAAG